MIDFLKEYPFVFGLLVGLLAAIAVWVRSLILASTREREITRLKELLHTKLEVEARAQKALQEELEGLRKQNENLRISVKSLQQKPDRSDLRLLHIYDRALRTLLARSPGFGPAWQSVLEEAEKEMGDTDSGLGAFVRRVFAPVTVRSLPEQAEAVEDEPRK